ncbi:protein translocase subunit SecF [Candidatus Uhrbacteria bacterium]|nr:protein translocase subunit SecF [Candidatus Uhrbacteria bacterium]
MTFPIISHRKIYFMISGALVVASIIALLLWGLKPGIDFTGGTAIEVSFVGERPNVQATHDALGGLNLDTISISPVGDNSFTLRTRPLTSTEHDQVLPALQKTFPGQDPKNPRVTEDQFETVGPIIGSELRRKTIWAIIFAIIGIVLLITWSFRKVSYPVKSWKYGVATIVALLHDVIIPTGAFALMGRLYGYEANALLVVALLTILGFSVHDTIVVFDRTRENLLKHRNLAFAEVVNRSVNETFIRSINTSVTLLIILATTLFFGGETIRDFILTLLIGVFFGTYSSIFIASPLLVAWQEWEQRRKM